MNWPTLYRFRIPLTTTLLSFRKTNMIVTYDYLGKHGCAEYFKYEIDYSAPGAAELTDAELLRGARADAEHYGGTVYRDDCTIVVYPDVALVDSFEIEGTLVYC